MLKEKILIIDDEPDIRDILNIKLSKFYLVSEATNGQDGLRIAKSMSPDLIITDCNMPGMNGYEFCALLRQDIILRHLPVIMLTAKNETQDMVDGIESGADDYLVKPFDPDTLLARIRMILKRTTRSLDANPLTHLPGNLSIMEEFQKHIDSGKLFAVGYADLDKFKVYNDKYGFEQGDKIICGLARVLVDITQKLCGPKAFVGHIGGDDFVFICQDSIADVVSQKVIDAFDKLSPTFYNDVDRKAGFILGVDRNNNPIKAALVSVSIGIVSNANQQITHVAQIGEIGAELKKYAKSAGKSNFKRDQRKTK